ncbi:Hsp70 family protein [Nocardia terpenica]|uniref:Hsp70 family protein n=1 Tax=Nocardia terpenica TaxID=455432 RepID=UPI0018945578|nr:Hsp70 family protein [Nocardia terpenica]MBF6065781.1 Hsp70 family protein [Nocardia terpenica]MBF6108456.1 Hsp70 family protein [Nocardia terpenica]MBF6115896.1 Hsp70 family protein [Nocardia terpenica]MBF6123026.1 Hsp70 family protein [Nocardia terpenica]MBF6156300.1 Hsp70 family protein [Nocardia terpenica]
MSIGTVNSVWVTAAGERERPVVRVRRTAVTFDSVGGARIGGIPRFAPLVTDFADLTRDIEPVVLGGRIWWPADLVAAVIDCLIEVGESAAGPVATYPACYSVRQGGMLRHALDRIGAVDVLLMPEPVAAVEWLDAEYGVSENGLTLVYDLGGNCLDVAVVRTEADRDERGVLGRAVRSYEFGGRTLGAILARYARSLSPGASSPVSKVIPACDTSRLRAWHVRNSLRAVRNCVHAAGLTMPDIDRVLVVGGAARPVEVELVLADLGRPVVVPPDPAHVVAVGAALASARLADAAGSAGRYARGAAVLSSAAVASALAMSAATMVGGGGVGTDGTTLEFGPALAEPANRVHDHPVDLRLSDGSDLTTEVSAGADALVSFTGFGPYTPAAQGLSPASAPDAGVPAAIESHGPGTHCDPVGPGRQPYSDPAHFVNPLPFYPVPDSTLARPTVGAIPKISLPPSYPRANPPGDLRNSPGSHDTGTGLAGTGTVRTPGDDNSLSHPTPSSSTADSGIESNGTSSGAASSDSAPGHTAPVGGNPHGAPLPGGLPPSGDMHTNTGESAPGGGSDSADTATDHTPSDSTDPTHDSSAPGDHNPADDHSTSGGSSPAHTSTPDGSSPSSSSPSGGGSPSHGSPSDGSSPSHSSSPGGSSPAHSSPSSGNPPSHNTFGGGLPPSGAHAFSGGFSGGSHIAGQR